MQLIPAQKLAEILKVNVTTIDAEQHAAYINMNIQKAEGAAGIKC